MINSRNFRALVLAGTRDEDDPVARHTGAIAKAAVRVGGTPMVVRVLSALRGSRSVDGVIVVGLADEAFGDSDLARALTGLRPAFEPGAETPASSVAAILKDIPAQTPVLVTTADHALLTADIVDEFLDAAGDADADAVIGLAPYDLVAAEAPGTQRTVTRLRGGEYCGCNLFALLTPRGRAAVEFWRRMERHRKHPVGIARALGAGTLLRYLFRRMTLDDAMGRLSELAGARVRAVLLPHGRAAIDVDTPEDLVLVQSLLDA